MRRLGAGQVAAGWVLASRAGATAVGTPVFSRLVRPRRLALMGPPAVATYATLVLTAPGFADHPLAARAQGPP